MRANNPIPRALSSFHQSRQDCLGSASIAINRLNCDERLTTGSFSPLAMRERIAFRPTIAFIGKRARFLSTAQPWYAPQDAEDTSTKSAASPYPGRTALSVKSKYKPNHRERRPRHIWSYDELLVRTERLKSVAEGKIEDRTVRVDHYFDVLEAWMECALEFGQGDENDVPGIEAARRARDLLNALEQNLDPEGSRSGVLVPVISFYDVVLQAYAVCNGGVPAAMEAQDLLAGMLKDCRDASYHGEGNSPQPVYPEPSIKSFNIVMRCWAKSRSKDCGVRAETILLWLEQWRCECEVALAEQPSHPYKGCWATSTTLSTLIHAWTQSGHFQAPERALQLLNESIETQRSPWTSQRFGNVFIDAPLLNSVILAWARSSRGRQGAEKAEETLALAVKLHEEGIMKTMPSCRTFALVLEAWAQSNTTSGEGAQRAHEILTNMVRLYREGLPVDLHAVTFTICIAAWAKCTRRDDSPDRADEVMGMLLSLYSETQISALKPDQKIWNTLIMAWSNATRRPDSMDRCVQILEEMRAKDCPPDLVSFGTVLHAAGRRGLGDRALELLDQLFVHYNQTSALRPTVRCLNAVLESLAREERDDSVQRAQSFFDRMDTEEGFARPDAISFTILMDAWSKSSDRQKALRTHELLREMSRRFQRGDRRCRPDAYAISVVIKACTSTTGSDEEKQAALDLALQTFHQCEASFGVRRNHVVYAAALFAVNALAGNMQQRQKLLQSIFDQCRAQGQVTAASLLAMRRGGAEDSIGEVNESHSRYVPVAKRP